MDMVGHYIPKSLNCCTDSESNHKEVYEYAFTLVEPVL